MRLDDKFRMESGSAYLTGIQALVRLPLDQMRRDLRAGLNTATFISGYEGSPLGGYDMALERNRSLLEENRIHFVPGLNEDLAATAVLGSQIFHVLGESNYDGVVGIWYGKGPGVDRSGDILRHANLAGTGKNCAALVLGGDDHASKSSTAPHQSDLSFYNFGMPILYPGNVQEILDFGLAGIALSRFSGAWVAMKLVTNVCDSGGTAMLDPARVKFAIPEDYEKRSDARLVIPHTLGLEPEVNYRRLDAARAFCRMNGLNRITGAQKPAWLGVATAGKSYYDMVQAFTDMGLRSEDLASLGIRIAHFGMTFPLEPQFVSDFARDVETILVIEEKRCFLELQLREALYHSAARPRILGKTGLDGAPLFPSTFELDPERIAKAIGPMILARTPVESVKSRLGLIDEIAARERHAITARTPTFCPGCPHNRSTMLLEGQVAGGGIGCHGMAAQFSRYSDSYAFLTHMGGEGAPWIGMAPFVRRKHIFQNIGDGTYFHSGSLSLQASVAAGVNITFKIIYNGAVAMTGGQDVYGALPIPDLTRKLAAEGVKKIIVLTDELSKYTKDVKVAENASVRDRDQLPEAMRELEKIPGVTVMIYDQQCAAEKRRLRSRGKAVEPTVRLVIHEEVCEGCGDCVQQSGCMSLHPVQTEFGTKTRIHQSSCNKDYSCALGDCPSFVTVRIKEGTGQRKKGPLNLPPIEVEEPRDKVQAGEGYSILSPGIGGTGVVTINALLATAAWIDGISAVTLDQTGLAQKGGAVLSSIVLSEKPAELCSKIGYGNADLLLGFDLLGAGAPDNLNRAHPSRTVAVVNTAETPTVGSIRNQLALVGPRHIVQLIEAHTRRGRNMFVDATRIAEGLFASHLAVNVFLLGAAYQGGLIPLSGTAIEEAIRLNGVEAERNIQAFQWGRKYYEDAHYVEELLEPSRPAAPAVDRAAELAKYQNGKYAERYSDFLQRVAEREPALVETVARYLYKLMAYKDEYEVARLLTLPEFRKRLESEWENVQSVSYNLHPPLLRALGWKKKLKLGPWFRVPLRALSAMKAVRGTAFDVFGYSAGRREERALIEWYRDLIMRVLQSVTPENLQQALEIAALPDRIRGYENIKRANVIKVKALAEEKLSLMRGAGTPACRVGTLADTPFRRT